VPQRNVVDSSGWIEYFADGPNAEFFEDAITDAASLVVPWISIYEVFKRLLREPDGEEVALQVIAAMQRGRVVNLDAELALDAAKTSFETELPMADSIILATAHTYQATLWTQDADFEGMADVRYVEKR
jgi:predicted nucleic acid-binding protein